MFAVGSLPDMLKFSKDCSTIVVAVEGEAFMLGGDFIDPPGEVAIIKFPETPAGGQYQLHRLDFSTFDERYVTETTRLSRRQLVLMV